MIGNTPSALPQPAIQNRYFIPSTKYSRTSSNGSSDTSLTSLIKMEKQLQMAL